jgi:putative YphP/YqiW family bacilliredoxin
MAVYPEYMVAPIRQDLTEVGFEQLMTPEEVDSTFASNEGTVLVAVNSVCGCAAAKARPALKMALTCSRILPRRPASPCSKTASWCT